MDDAVILSKLDTLQRCVERIESKTPATAELLAADIDAQDIISINLERAVQACVDIAARILADRNRPPPETMAGAFEELCRLGLLPESVASQMKKAVGFRNIAVHAYKNIDWARVYALVTTRLDDFRVFAKSILRLP
jgi:uncharacterized protein YutE (UPF0331/DUF86 family)